jgi:phosphoribosylformylglycinamidine synthase
MLWEFEILPKQHDPESARVNEELGLLTHSAQTAVDLASRGFLVEGPLDESQARRLLEELLQDPIAETGRVGGLNAFARFEPHLHALATVLLKPGVMDPVAQSVEDAARDLGMRLDSIRTFRRYYRQTPLEGPTREILFRKVLANEAIEQVVPGPLALEHLALGSRYDFQLVRVPIRDLDDTGLLTLSREGQLSLNLDEMRTIQAHFRSQNREPTDVELETIAQTWSEHCSHKTLKGQIDFEFIDAAGRTSKQRIRNLLKETIFGATQELRKQFGADDWCVSVFEDNAGIVKFNDQYNVCFKVETHNHPSAIEPYGGSNTGIGGVIRDLLGTGLGAKPICNTDVFCFAPPDLPEGYELPAGVLHPKKVMKGVVAGVRDYGNRMGIPTVNGAVLFDPDYIGNPLVYCGTVGLIPANQCFKSAKPGDLIVALGGRTGRDGIHGATFSSIELTSESEKVSGGAVQIGNAITEKKLMDVLLQARDRGLFTAVTDCGAGGFSSAVGEMGEKIGARVDLDKAPLKYEGLSYTEIWISEAQERMVLAVPPMKWEALHALCDGEGVEATALGTFEATGRLRLYYKGHEVADLDMKFLHDGRPDVVRQAVWQSPPSPGGEVLRTPGIQNLQASNPGIRSTSSLGLNDILLKILAHPNVASKEWIIRQYDHEVQGGSVVKPLVGIANDGPGDAAVVMPVLGQWQGVAVGNGICPQFGRLDPYRMAALAIDEAVRNVVAVGADPSRIALLDNFCWGNTDRPEVLGSLVRAAQACRDVALAYRMPFISGKDSLKNEFRHGERLIVIPPTLLISALGLVRDVRRCVTMDIKEAGSALYLIGATRDEMAGSHHGLVTGTCRGDVPQVDLAAAPRLFAKVHEAIATGVVRSCHDLSEGGLAVALAEMAFAGGVGIDVTELGNAGSLPAETLLFSESPTRFLVEVPAAHEDAARSLFGADAVRMGRTVKEKRLRVADATGEWVIWQPLDALKNAWQNPFKW